jgi:hypothetical protein
VIDFGSVHSSPYQPDKFALRWVSLATALNGYRQAGSSTLHAHHVGTYRPYERNYLGAGYIAVVLHAAFAAPLAHVQRKFRPNQATVRTYARRALPWVNLEHLATMPVCLVSDLAGQLAKAHIADRTRKFVVSQHPLHIVGLYRQRLVLANQLTTRFVQKILACVSNPGVQASHPKPLLSVSVRPFPLSGQPALRPLEVLFTLLYMARVAGLVASRGHNHVLHPKVHTDICASLHMMSAEVGLLGQGLDFDLAGKADKVAARGVAPDRDHLGHALNLARPAQLERPKLGQHQPMGTGRKRPMNVPLVKLIAYRLRLMLALEAGIPGAALKKVLKGMVLVTQHLGQNGAVGLTEPGALTPLKFRDLAGNINARKALTALLVRRSSA